MVGKLVVVVGGVQVECTVGRYREQWGKDNIALRLGTDTCVAPECAGLVTNIGVVVDTGCF